MERQGAPISADSRLIATLNVVLIFVLPPLIVAMATVIMAVNGNSPHSSYLATIELGKLVGLIFGVIFIFKMAHSPVPAHIGHIEAGRRSHPVLGLLFICFILVFAWFHELSIELNAGRLISHPAVIVGLLTILLGTLTGLTRILIFRFTQRGLQ